jgi:hypothetical protein
MNIDERIEALVQSVELLAQIHKDNEKRMKRTDKYMRAMMQMVLDHEARIRFAEGTDDDDEEESEQ